MSAGKRAEDAFPWKLRSCVWEITLACCFSCSYCGSRAGAARKQELTTAECLSVAEQLRDLSCSRVSLIGGEVFLRPDWDRIVRALADGGIAVNIITNGFLFTEEILAKLRTLRIESVSVSVDGTEELHDRYRQKGSYARAFRAISVLREAGIPVSVITTLNAENVRALPKLYESLRETGIGAWQLQACSPMGNAAASGIDFRFDPREVIRFVEERLPEAPFLLGIADNIGYYTENEGSLRGNRSGRAFFGGCRAGLTSVGIDSEGNVRGCESMYDEAFNEGNLRERPLREIWEDPHAFRYNRAFTPELLTGTCRSCSFGEVCGGGCRSYNHFVHGKLYESPRCARNF